MVNGIERAGRFLGGRHAPFVGDVRRRIREQIGPAGDHDPLPQGERELRPLSIGRQVNFVNALDSAADLV